MKEELDMLFLLEHFRLEDLVKAEEDNLSKKKIMEKIEKGAIIEIKVPNVEKPIKAVVIDTIHHIVDNREYFGTLILYAQKRLFKAECIGWKVEDYNELGETTVSWEYGEPHYEDIIVDYCEIPEIPSDI